jgi:hypothetical protein
MTYSFEEFINLEFCWNGYDNSWPRHRNNWTVHNQYLSSIHISYTHVNGIRIYDDDTLVLELTRPFPISMEELYKCYLSLEDAKKLKVSDVILEL